jgi:enoyl-CoA hydratase
VAIRIEKTESVATIILSRPEAKNAIDRKTAEELADAFRDFEADPSLKAAVLCGDHGTFCSGADLKAIAAGNPNRLDPRGDAPLGPTRMFLSKPTVAAISGYAVAGGLELALMCDLRVADEDAIMGVFCRRWGVPLTDGGTVRLPRLIGLSRALDLILTGRPVSAREALEFGLVNRVSEKGRCREVAEELARSISRFPQSCLRNDRMSAYEQFDLTFDEAMANEFQKGLQTLKSGETVQGAGMFSRGMGRHGSFEK